jgi:hypothetical protein
MLFQESSNSLVFLCSTRDIASPRFLRVSILWLRRLGRNVWTKLLVTTLTATYFMVSDESARVPVPAPASLILIVFRHTRWIKDVSIMRVAGRSGRLKQITTAHLWILVSGYGLGGASNGGFVLVGWYRLAEIVIHTAS